jgi:cell division protein FtsQ
MLMAEPEPKPLPGELEDEEETPFRRRQKAVPVRRGRFWRLRRLLRAAVYVLVLLPLLVYAAYRLRLYVLDSPRFRLTSAADVAVSGNRFVSREEVLNALGFPASGKLKSGVNIFRLSLEAERRRLTSIPWVRTATVTRSYPHRLAVNLVERTPVAFVNISGNVKLVDGEGVILDKPERATFDFPVLTGLDVAGSPGERRSRLDLYQEFTREVGDEATKSGWMVSEVDLSDAEDLKALLVEGGETVQVHFGQKDFGERFHNFLALLPEIHKTNSKINSMDLRYRNQIVVNPGTPAPRETSSAAAGTTRKD